MVSGRSPKVNEVPNDSASLAGALRHAITDDRDRAERSIAARAFARRFVWPAVSASLMSEYAAVVRSAPARVAAS